MRKAQRYRFRLLCVLLFLQVFHCFGSRFKYIIRGKYLHKYFELGQRFPNCVSPQLTFQFISFLTKDMNISFPTAASYQDLNLLCVQKITACHICSSFVDSDFEVLKKLSKIDE